MRLPDTTRPVARRALTASAAQTTRQNAGRQRRAKQSWQSRAFAYYDLVPELHFASQFYAKPLSRIRIFPAERDPQTGVVNPLEDTQLTKELDRIQDPGGGRSVMLSAYGQLMFIAGEAYMLGTHTEDDEPEKWEIVSTDELRVSEDGSVRRYTAPTIETEVLRPVEDKDFKPIDGDPIVIRLWTRHPRYSELADSPLRAVLDVAEELVMLTLAIRARNRSRLSGAVSGILYVANEIGPPPIVPTGSEDPMSDPFMEDLTEHIIEPIEDDGSPASLAPYILRGPARIGDVPAKDALFHIKLSDPAESIHEKGLREEAIRRMAIGMDFDPSELEGKADVNHWNGRLLEEERWQQHQGPVAQRFCDEIGGLFLRQRAKDLGIAGWERVTVGYDASEILANPDRSGDANDLFDRRAIGKSALRKAKNFDDEDAPTDEELAEMIAIAMRRPELLDADTLEPVDAVTSAPDDEVDDTGSDEDPPAAPNKADDTKGQEDAIAASGRDHLAARIAAAAELALERCREVAGARLRSRKDSCPECLEHAAGVPQALVAATLGPDMLERLGAPSALELVAGGADTFRSRVSSWTGSQASGSRAGDLVERIAAASLFDEQPFREPLELAL